jgi:hypothetical protein
MRGADFSTNSASITANTKVSRSGARSALGWASRGSPLGSFFGFWLFRERRDASVDGPYRQFKISLMRQESFLQLVPLFVGEPLVLEEF